MFMKIQLDTTNKTIQILDEVNLEDLLNFLEESNIDYSNYKLIPYTTIDYIKNPFYKQDDTIVSPLTTPSPPWTITSDSNTIKANNADIIPCTITSSVKDAIKLQGMDSYWTSK